MYIPADIPADIPAGIPADIPADILWSTVKQIFECSWVFKKNLDDRWIQKTN